MIKEECNHLWMDTRNGKYTCLLCNKWLLASDVFQLEAIKNQTKLAKHQLGFQKWLSLVAVIISFISLIIAVFIAIYK